MIHTWATDVEPTKRAPLQETCNTQGKGGVSNCGDDVAKQMLEHMLFNIPGGPSELNSKSNNWRNEGVLKKFDQTEFFEAGMFEYTGLSETGYYYAPNTCLENQCKVHVVFHGCGQGHDLVELDHIEYAGLNEWAATN